MVLLQLGQEFRRHSTQAGSIQEKKERSSSLARSLARERECRIILAGRRKKIHERTHPSSKDGGATTKPNFLTRRRLRFTARPLGKIDRRIVTTGRDRSESRQLDFRQRSHCALSRSRRLEASEESSGPSSPAIRVSPESYAEHSTPRRGKRAVPKGASPEGPLLGDHEDAIARRSDADESAGFSPRRAINAMRRRYANIGARGSSCDPTCERLTRERERERERGARRTSRDC